MLLENKSLETFFEKMKKVWIKSRKKSSNNNRDFNWYASWTWLLQQNGFDKQKVHWNQLILWVNVNWRSRSSLGFASEANQLIFKRIDFEILWIYGKRRVVQTENLASLRIRSLETNSDSDSLVQRTLRVRAAQGHFVTASKLSATSFDKDDLSSWKTTLPFVSENRMTRKLSINEVIII